jgi:hypothetical protein
MVNSPPPAFGTEIFGINDPPVSFCDDIKLLHGFEFAGQEDDPGPSKCRLVAADQRSDGIEAPAGSGSGSS